MLREEKARTNNQLLGFKNKLNKQERVIKGQDMEILNQRNEFQNKILALERDVIEFAKFKSKSRIAKL